MSYYRYLIDVRKGIPGLKQSGIFGLQGRLTSDGKENTQRSQIGFRSPQYQRDDDDVLTPRVRLFK